MQTTNIKIERGVAAYSLFVDNDFLKKWKALAMSVNYFTLFQENSFVIPWFTTYKHDFEPIMVLGYNQASELVGVIPLALSLKNNNLTFAGTNYAEYKGWLCKEMICDQFLIEALIKLKEQFKLSNNWNWNWISSNLNLDFLSSNKLRAKGIYSEIKVENSPILDLLNFEVVEKLKKSRSIKTKMNRLKRKGEIYIQRITTIEQAQNIFPILERQCNFRQMGINQVRPFIDDPYKKTFLINRLEYPESIHFSVLWLNNKPLAFNIGDCDSITVSLGVISHDPLEGKNSPGLIFLILLADFLREEGYNYFDLTPGEGYKKRFSNLYVEVPRLTLTFNRKQKLISKFKGNLKTGAKKILSSLRIDASKALIVLKNNPLEILMHFKECLYKKRSIYFFEINQKSTTFEKDDASNNIRVNEYSDLFLPNKNGLAIDTTVFSFALKQFEKESKLFTKVENNILLGYLWATKEVNSIKMPEIDLDLKLASNFLILYSPMDNTFDKKETFIARVLSQVKLYFDVNNIEKILIMKKHNDEFLDGFLDNLECTQYLKYEILEIFNQKKIRITYFPKP